MRYQSNLIAPDLAPYFRLLDPPMQHMGHDVPSDPDFLPECGFMTADEAAILYHCAKAWPFQWADIGARFGWSSAHLALASRSVCAIDPELADISARLRFCSNTSVIALSGFPVSYNPVTSCEWFEGPGMSRNMRIKAACIDGNHDAPEPYLDAARAIRAGASVVVWHDFQGKPVRDAVAAILDGLPDEHPGAWKARVYWTPNGMAVAWRDGCGFVPPDHVPDPAIFWPGIMARYAVDFDFSRVSGSFGEFAHD